VAHPLLALGLFADQSYSDILHTLDVHSGPDDRTGDAWSIGTLRRSLTERKEFDLEEQPIINGGCMKLLDGVSSFLINGILNKSYVVKGERFYHPDDDEWRHTVAIRGTQLLCRGLMDEHAVVTTLRLTRKGVPQKKYGYMQEIISVYKVVEL
jgi:hypothetical protein